MDIDVVVMWVDGNDAEWIKEKEKYAPVKQDDSNSSNRFRDWNLMKYWFRGIEKNMPWVRKIFFVTWGHTPSFLNLDHPKLRVVKHDEYIPEQYLPTFSANPIELNLHRITDLSENFILFNDDFFVIKPLNESYFFKNGKPCVYFAELPLAMAGEFEAWQWMVINDLKIINKHFNKKNSILKNPLLYFNPAFQFKDNVRSLLLSTAYHTYFTGFKVTHSASAFNKRVFREVWDKEYDVLDHTSKHRFRNRDDVNQWLFLWWQIAKGDFTPQKMTPYVDDVTEDSIHELCERITKQKNEIICLNDPTGEVDFNKLSSILHDAFEKILPEKCSFEK